MSLPTLLQNDKIVKLRWMSKEQKALITSAPSIEFLIQHITDLRWGGRDVKPKIRMSGLGAKVLVLKSATGSGKSSVLPPELYKKFFDTDPRSIVITQPTKATVLDIPYQIVQYNDFLKIGDNIGYQTGGLSLKPIKGLLFATVGILLQHLKTLTDEQFMSKYSFVIIDEVHKRTVELDTCLFYLKQFLLRNWTEPRCPLIILMSATFKEKPYIDYFDVPRTNYLEVVGSSFPIEDNFTNFDVSDIFSYTADLVESIHVENIADITEDSEFRDILVFVQSKSAVKEVANRINRLNSEVFSKGIEASKLHSKAQMLKYKTGGAEPLQCYYLAPIQAMSADLQAGGKEYQNLFADIETVNVEIYELGSNGEPTEKVIKTFPASRRVVIGTNAIETGMTIETLKYCIDTGFAIDVSFNPTIGTAILTDGAVNQASSVQRRGRVGRKAPGFFYATYTKETFNTMQVSPHPDIIKEDITQFLLSVIIDFTETEIIQIDINQRTEDSFQMNQFDQNWYEIKYGKVFNAKLLDFMQYPSSDGISYSVEKLHGLGFITHEYQPTIFGVYANKFRKQNIENIRMILAGYHYGCNILDLITITSFLNGKRNLGIKPHKYTPMNPLNVKDEQAFYYYKMLFRDDFVEFLFIWDSFMSVVETIHKDKKTDKLDKWAEDNKISLSGMFQIAELRDELISDLLTMGLDPYFNNLGLPRGSYNLVGILKKNLLEGMEEVRKIKQSIYEGYRFNLLIYNSIARSYTVNHTSMSINVNSKIVKAIKINDEYAVPKKIIVSSMMLGKSFTNPGVFELSGSDVSVMDGFVDIDINFLKN